MLHMIENYSEFELYLPDERFETIDSKIGAFYLFDSCRAPPPQKNDLCHFF